MRALTVEPLIVVGDEADADNFIVDEAGKFKIDKHAHIGAYKSRSAACAS